MPRGRSAVRSVSGATTTRCAGCSARAPPGESQRTQQPRRQRRPLLRPEPHRQQGQGIARRAARWRRHAPHLRGRLEARRNRRQRTRACAPGRRRFRISRPPAAAVRDRRAAPSRAARASGARRAKQSFEREPERAAAAPRRATGARRRARPTRWRRSPAPPSAAQASRRGVRDASPVSAAQASRPGAPARRRRRSCLRAPLPASAPGGAPARSAPRPSRRRVSRTPRRAARR